MGIAHLNSYIRNNTSESSILKVNLSSLYGKIIAVDVSIYLYKFLAEEALLENMYMMMSLFKFYNITPIFVFDGIPPIEKTELLTKRYNDKMEAEKEYCVLKEQYSCTTSKENQKSIIYNMNSLRKKFIRLKKSDILKVQELIAAFGLTYIEAIGEADELCAKLVIKKKAYACLSEDMDMFVYGCYRVLRYLSLINETVIIYHLDKILIDLKLSLKEFKEICIISGTDYNLNINNKTNLYKTFHYFKIYKSISNKDNKMEFYTWLDNTTDYINNIYKLYNIYNIFLTENIELQKIQIQINPMNMNKIKEIMTQEGFIFL